MAKRKNRSREFIDDSDDPEDTGVSYLAYWRLLFGLDPALKDVEMKTQRAHVYEVIGDENPFSTLAYSKARTTVIPVLTVRVDSLVTDPNDPSVDHLCREGGRVF